MRPIKGAFFYVCNTIVTKVMNEVSFKKVSRVIFTINYSNGSSNLLLMEGDIHL